MYAIAELDRQLAEMNQRIQEEVNKQRRIQPEIDALQMSIVEQHQRIASFEKEHQELSKSIGTTDVTEIKLSIAANQRVIRDLNKAKIEARRNRDEAMAKLRNIQTRVSQRYAEAEWEFLGLFKDLAEAFTGLDLDIRFDVRRTEMHLVLDVEGQSRRQQHQLSESQRFFVDIALRMAVTMFTASDGTGTLLVDTPEGSLDIAYESRAGEMFARFVGNGYHLLMTANINTSQLLRELARRCGTERMSIERMTEWTALSDVQANAQHLFRNAYELIEAELNGAGNGDNLAS